MGLVAAGLAGCGGTSSEISTIDFKSPAVNSRGVIEPAVHCGWGALWLPLRWGDVPAGTKELAIYIGRFKYEHRGGRIAPVITWADLIYHLKPSIHGNPANVLPHGAIWSAVGRRSCPIPWGNQKIAQVILALKSTRSKRHLTRGLAATLAEEARRSQGAPDRTFPPEPPIEDAVGLGSFVAGYAPGSGPS